MIKQKLSKEEEQNNVVTKGEVKYKILMNPDREKYNEIREKLKSNNYYCLTHPNERCMCKEFTNSEVENTLCGCGLYMKQLRTEQEIKKYVSSKKIFSKNEKKILTEKVEDEEESFMATNSDSSEDD